MTNLQTTKPQRFDDSMLEVDVEKGMVNLTAIARACPEGKRLSKWRELDATKELLLAYEAINPQAVIAKKGGNGEQGTRAVKDLALDFMQWISPQLKVYCLGKLNELFTSGTTMIKPMTPIQMLVLQAQAMQELEERTNKIEEQTSRIEDKLLQIESKSLSINTDYYTISGYCNLKGLSNPLSQAQYYGKMCSKKSKELEYSIGIYYDAKYGNVNTYHIDVLSRVIR